MIGRRALVLGLVLIAPGGAEARAHFLFARIGPVAEGGRAVEVYFSDRAEAGDPKFVDKIAAPTKLWLQTAPGEFRPLEVRKGVDRLRAHVPASGGVAVVGECEYGVIARPGQTPFLLRYYPKALAGRPEGLNRMAPRAEIPLEVVAEFDGPRVRLTALHHGKPMPDAVFRAVDADLTEAEIQADASGRVTWSPSAPGPYAVYTRLDTKEAGEAGGKKYEEIREFATLALDWPLVREGADPQAVALFREAVATRAQWADFPGFSARVEGEVDGHAFSGTATVDASGSVALEGLDAAATGWVKGQLESLVMHRLAEAADSAEPVLRRADDREDHPLGRLLAVEGGRFAASYRIKDRRITAVNRHLGRVDMTILTLDQEANAEGRDLPRSYVVQYWDDLTGALGRVETVQDRWTRVGPFDLPAAHTVTTAADGGQALRQLRLSGHKLSGGE